MPNVYKVQVPYSANKAELKQLLRAHLVGQGILPKPAAAAGDAASDTPGAEVKVVGAAATFAAGPVTDILMGDHT